MLPWPRVAGNVLQSSAIRSESNTESIAGWAIRVVLARNHAMILMLVA